MSAKTPTRRISTPTEKEGFEKRIESEAKLRAETDEFYPVDGIPQGDSEQVRRIKGVMANQERDSLSKYERDQLEKEGDEILAWLVPKMWTYAQMGMQQVTNGYLNPEFRKAAAYGANEGELSPEFQKRAERWKFIQRELGRSSSLEDRRLAR